LRSAAWAEAGDDLALMVDSLVHRRVAIHPTAVVEPGAVVGDGSRVWHQSHVRDGARIGAGCTIGFSVYIDAGAVIGDRCKIQNHVSVYRGVTLEDDVFVGPAATFTNDIYPRATSGEWEIMPTLVRRGASIGAHATIVCGVELGEWSMVAAGAVVAHDVPARGLVMGIPAHLRSWVCECGRPLAAAGDVPPHRCAHCGQRTQAVGRA
jgi:UDP-2-acetamido-3-amino-2,3-dideoxy-glucuronate N-acetyltransferase